jgi:uncharacterized repeat protein (TIGR03803 family)
VAGLVEAQDGLLYGTVPSGGSLNAGVIYRIAKDGTGYAVIHQFDRPADGRSPVAGLLSASDGYLYGTAAAGGSNNIGIVFRLAPTNSEYTILYHFSGIDGSNPSARLIEGADGLLYGTTRKGGAANHGVVFRIRKDGMGGVAVLRNFLGAAQFDGREPLAGVTQTPDGMLYGTTYFGGSADYGSIFRVSTNGTGYSVIWHCQYATTNGIQPSAALVYGDNGLLYGTMPLGGQTYGGIAFAIRTNGTDFSILHSFTGANGDGLEPYAPLLRMENGDLYGTTFSGGDYPANTVKGTIFKLSSLAGSGRLRILTPSVAQVLIESTGGLPGRTYTIQRSSTLLPGSWTSIGSRTNDISGSFSFVDPDGRVLPSQWYRTVLE